MENKKSFAWYAVLGVLGVTLLTWFDQWIKQLAVTHLKGQEDIVLWKGVFQFHYLENKGAAFGIMQNQRILFIILTLLYLAVITWIYYRIPREKKYLIFHILSVVITAGAIGNFMDRFRFGYVIDMLYFSLIDFPVFNVADIYVVCAFIVLMICVLFIYKEEDFSFLSIKNKENK